MGRILAGLRRKAAAGGLLAASLRIRRPLLPAGHAEIVAVEATLAAAQ